MLCEAARTGCGGGVGGGGGVGSGGGDCCENYQLEFVREREREMQNKIAKVHQTTWNSFPQKRCTHIFIARTPVYSSHHWRRVRVLELRLRRVVSILLVIS